MPRRKSGGSEPNILRTSRSYEINLKIKGENYSNDVSNVRISSSLATGYQIVMITINVTPQTILLNKLYGQDAIMLEIKKLDETENVVTETMNFDLMLLNSSFDIPLSDILIEDTQKDRSEFDLITVPRIPFETMTTMVNPVFGIGPGGKTAWTGPKTIKEMIEAIVNELITTGPKLEYDEDGQNEDQILQCCIPPTTFYKAVQELDKNFGIYNGTPVVFCNHDNTIKVMNLSSRIKKNFDLFVEQLTLESKEEDIIKASDLKYFYTYDDLFTKYVGNSKFGVLGKTIKHIVLPSDELSHTIETDLDDICNSFGVVGQTKGEVTHINTSATKRIKYYIDNNGFEKSESFINSSLSKQISDISRLNFMIERNLAIEHLLQVGCCVKIKTNTISHQDISGKYILFSSDLIWTKEAEWQTTAQLELIRTNKTI